MLSNAGRRPKQEKTRKLPLQVEDDTTPTPTHSHQSEIENPQN